MNKVKLFRAALFLILLFSSISTTLKAEDKKNNVGEVKSKLELLSAVNMNTPSKSFIDLNSRRTKSIIFSTLIPGSGQTYLGNELKGIGFTVGFFGTALTAVLAHNNMSGREDRITSLTQSYLTSADFETAEEVWQEMKFEEGNRDNDHKRRQIFSYAAIGVWVLNMVDIIFFNEDKGADEFSMNNKPGFNFSISSVSDVPGVELKFILP